MTQTFATLAFVFGKQQNIIGEYNGDLACADCEKKEYHDNLKPDMTDQKRRCC
ncbi:hypothetical protein GO003_010605 [Methylicorpusculum oleiharenae]|uniref:hypothetical protein n=1 Tax=Methylicorpusculum oleiharenae TaxID=1338687 RepID=UPI0013575715|nr:hypothetical protein [Methylicorpusculum oleiharenae]MCD2450841.1 hypothetical protein [Methylicorpusculum oleiharenae]